MRWSLKYIPLFVFSFAFQLHLFGNEGEPLFIENCAICHSIGQGDIIGPDLKNIHQKRSYKYFQSFVKNSFELINSGDSIAVSVFQDYDESIMPEQSLSEVQINEIWQFVQTFKGEAVYEFTFPDVKEKSSNYKFVYLLIFVVLGIAIIFGRKWLKILVEKIPKRLPFQQLLAKRWKIITLLLLFFFVLLEFNNIGIFKGYQPKQPIHFSHKIHCTQNEISCKYCHYEAYKGEHGGIPSLSTCMNCHRYVNKGSLTDTLEIAKLYDWVGFDFKSKEYNKAQKQMGWIKVNNLPDHARFNHHIHSHADVSCAECHGEVKQMTEIKQVSSLSMKWCVNCHTKKDIPLVGYYSDNESETKVLHALSVEERANYTLKTDTMYKAYKDMGGLDCYKCHN